MNCRDIYNVVLKRWEPPTDLLVSNWADKNRVLSQQASSEFGSWSTARAAYQREMMDVYCDKEIKQIVFMTSAQIGKTEIINNIIGYAIDQKPGPILVLQPTLQMGHAWSKDRLAPMLRDTKCLTDKIGAPGSRKSTNTLTHKIFPGGHVTVTGSNSAANLASRPVRDVFCDEVDRYPVSAGSEGDPVLLATKRTKNYHDSKIILTSTPTTKGLSRIENAFECSDKRRYHVPCPFCSAKNNLVWSNLQWKIDDNKVKDIWYECETCQKKINQSYKNEMVLNGEWIASATSNGIAGFHVNEMYSPWVAWEDIVYDFLSAKKTPETLRTWINTSLGETYEEKGERISPDNLYSRRETYKAQVPTDCLILVAGVDVQDDRLELEIKGFGDGYESWGIEYRIILGDTQQNQVWSDLDAILRNTYTHESGALMYIASCCIDSGHRTHIVYDYVKNRPGSRIFATKGVSGFSKPVVSAPMKKQTGREARKIVLFNVGADSTKVLLYSNLKILDKGPGFFHFPQNYNNEYFYQLTAEKCITKYVKGFPKKYWQKMRARNEALDINVLCYAAIKLINPIWHVIKKSIFIDAEHTKRNESQPSNKSNRRVRNSGIN